MDRNEKKKKVHIKEEKLKEFRECYLHPLVVLFSIITLSNTNSVYGQGQSYQRKRRNIKKWPNFKIT